MREEPFSRRLKDEAERELFRGLEFTAEMKDRVRRAIRDGVPRRARRPWLWTLPALGAAAVLVGMLVLRPGSFLPQTPSRAPSFASAPEKKIPLALQPPAALEQRPAAAPPETAAAPLQGRAPQVAEMDGARVTVGPLSAADPGRPYFPVRVELAAAQETPAALLDPDRWGFVLYRGAPGERSSPLTLRPEEVVRGPAHWEGKLVLPPAWGKGGFPLRLRVTWGSEARELLFP